MFNSGILKDEVLNEDVERVKSFYDHEGYIDATVEVEKKTDPKGLYWYLTFKIEEGKRYYIGNVTIKGNKDISIDKILAAMTDCKAGNVYSPDAVKKDILAIQGLYFDNGYIEISLLPIVS